MKKGRSPEGYAYWPAFPYTSFTGLHDSDLRDLWAFLQTLPAAPSPDVPHQIDRKRGILGLWRRLYFVDRGDEGRGEDPILDRGRYLVEVVGHCGECHTPRGARGNLLHRQALLGSDQPPEPAPPIRGPSVVTWTPSDWTTFLELGMTPDGDFVGGEMARVVREGTARLAAEDRAAMAAWLVGSR
jgi:mono/diheme cytochrome c family protein